MSVLVTQLGVKRDGIEVSKSIFATLGGLVMNLSSSRVASVSVKKQQKTTNKVLLSMEE
jgi:hypothetical protein